MTGAFEPGDPVLELAAHGQGIPITVLEQEDQPWIRKAEQLKIDEVRKSRNFRFPLRATKWDERHTCPFCFPGHYNSSGSYPAT